MKIKAAITHFGSQAEIARVLGYTEAAVSVWKARGKGKIIPFKSAIRLVKASHGELAIVLRDYE